MLGSRLRLLGVLFAGPTINHQGQITFGLPKVEVSTPMHLGFVIRASELLVLEEFVVQAVQALESFRNASTP